MYSEASLDRVESYDSKNVVVLPGQQVIDQLDVSDALVSFPECGASPKVFQDQIEILVQSVIWNNRRCTHTQHSLVLSPK